MYKKYKTLSLETASPNVLLVTLNRPESANALNTEMGEELLDIWSSFYRDQEKIRSIILTGEGNRAFCAGADLKERNGMKKSSWQQQHALFEQMIRAMMDCPVPIIGAVNGAAFAGGLEIALACDFIYATRKSRFAFTEVSIGIMPGAAGTQNLPKTVGIRRAKEIILSAQPFTAKQALEWGLVNKIVPTGKLILNATHTAKCIAEHAPLAIRNAKKSIDAAISSDFKTGYDFEIALYNQLVGTHDQIEGILSFNEKRKPKFKGQ
tara:strand:- start:670 stop:1464 length:795 start_codon:yes stop_codon:yes gene_type:complete